MLRSKRYIAAFLSAAMIMSSFSFWAFADDEVPVDDEVAAEEVQEEEEEEAPAVAEVVETAIEEEAVSAEADIVANEDSDEEAVTEPSDVTKSQLVSEEYDMGLANSDSLFEEYAEKRFNESISGYSKKSLAGNNLLGVNKAFYDALVPELKKISDGELNNAKIDTGNIGDMIATYSAADLGVDAITTTDLNNQNSTLRKKLSQRMQADYLVPVSEALRLDCSYELYWCTSSIGYHYGWYSGYTADSLTVFISDYYFKVDPRYRVNASDEQSVDTASTGTTMQAIANAKDIVKNAEGMSDYQKLEYYKNRICDLNSYNTVAAKQSETMTDRGPWALIYVFDGDDETNVVCEGYSEAFHYLYELSTFSNSSLLVYSVTGYMQANGSVSGAGPHKWNIVSIDGNNYLVDVTNCDSDSGANNWLFMRGMTDYGDGKTYYVSEDGKTVYYTYDEDIPYSSSQLAMCATDYVPSIATTPDDKIRLEGMNLTLKDDISMNFYFSDSNATTTGDSVTFKLSNGLFSTYLLTDMIKKTVTDGLTGKTSTYYVCSVELSAKDMTYEVPMYVISGSAYGVTKKYSIRQYANAVLAGNQYTETQKSLVKAMLNYGAYAQKYFGYNTENLANSTVNNISIVDNIPTSSVDLSSFSIDVSSLNGSVGFAGSSLVLSGKTSMKLYFDKTATISNVSCTNDSAVKVDVIKSGDGQYQIVRIRNISPASLDSSFTISMSVGGTSKTISVNPMAYGKAVLNMQDRDSLKNLVKALRLYNQAAKAIN